MTRAGLGMDEVIDRVVREHETTPPRALPYGQASAEVFALYHRIGSARLFDGRWQLVPMAERRFIDTGNAYRLTETLIEMSDGRSIAEMYDLETQDVHWLLGRVEEPALTDETAVDVLKVGRAGQRRFADDPADVLVLGSSLALLLDAALDSGGEVAHLETGRLSALL